MAMGWRAHRTARSGATECRIMAIIVWSECDSWRCERTIVSQWLGVLNRVEVIHGEEVDDGRSSGPGVT